MPMYSVGKILKNCRKEKKITQEQLCEGICTASALSKFENGHKEPTYVTFASLMERMGEWPEAYDIFLGDQSYWIQQQQSRIWRLLYCKDYEKVLEALDELEEVLKAYPNDVVYHQFLRLNRLMGSTKGFVGREQLGELEDILRMTAPSFGKKPLKELFLTHQEIMVVNDIAVGYGENGETEKAIMTLTELKEYLEQDFIGVRMRQSAYSTINRNLVKYLGQGGYHETAIRISYELIDKLRGMGKTLLVSDLYYSIAWNYMKMDRKKYIQEIEDAIVLSLYGDLSNRNYRNAEDIIAHVRENMGEMLERPNLRRCLDFYHRMAQQYSPKQTQ